MSTVSEQGIEVMVRIRPIASDEQDQRRCVFLSDCQENTIVVETNNKKEFFSFDYIASEVCQQQELYERLGHPVLDESLKGYNCCLFSYGQTGAGKTYSILGHQSQLIQDPLSNSRGILPRLLEEMFSRINDSCSGFQSVSVSCSYLQIYNQQIIDLMTKQSRNLAIREDLRRGVFVDGLTELTINSYQEVLGIITKGLAVRKTASTFMNSESSRSHTIFTMLLNIESEQEDVKRNLRSKLHIVDLAGSERTKLAKVEGERLKEGCNINKSLLTLSNVICSLVESGKKKKYIPFRDSKLTFFLKDSLGGNSKTKLLANISPKVSYIGDTISTLMFAKRAKIIRCKVEPNQNIADNFQSLRTQIRKLRQELAQTKFIKPITSLRAASPTSRRDPTSVLSNKDIFLPTESLLEINPNNSTQLEDTFRMFEDNQMAYRAMIQHYMERLKQCSNGMTHSVNFKNLFEEKKRLEKMVNSQQKMLHNFPAFSKIFSQSLQLKRKVKNLQLQLQLVKDQTKQKSIQVQTLLNTIQLLKVQIQNLEQYNQQILNSHFQPPESPRHKVDPIVLQRLHQHHRNLTSQGTSKREQKQQKSTRSRGNSTIITKKTGFRDIVERQNSIIDEYESTIEQIKKYFQQSMGTMRTAYNSLQQLYNQEKRQKHEIRRHRRKEPQMQTLANENQYLKLNVMELQTQILRLEEQLFKKGVEVRASKEEQSQLRSKFQEMERTSYENGIKQSELQTLIEKVRLIKIQVEKADLEVNQELERDSGQIHEMRNKLSKMTKENYSLLSKNESLVQQISVLKGKLSGLACIDQSVIEFKEGMDGTTTIDVEEDFTFEKTLHQDIVRDLERLTIQKQRLSVQVQDYEKQKMEQQTILEKASTKILTLTKEVNIYRQSSFGYAQQVRIANQKLQLLQREEKKYQDKIRMLDVDLVRLRKETEKNQSVAIYIKTHFEVEPMEFVEEAKYMRQRNFMLNQQNLRLRESLAQIERKTIMLKNSKSLSNLSTVKEVVGGSVGKNIIQVKDYHSGSISQREGENTMKRKDHLPPKKSNILTNLTQQKSKEKEKQKQKPSLQFKSKPPTQDSYRFMKKASK